MHRLIAGIKTLPVITAALFMAALPVSAAPPAQSERLAYNVMLGGLHVGDALVALRQDETGYTTEMKMTARGVAAWIQNFRADLKGEGSFIKAATANGRVEIMPEAFIRQWSAGEIASDMTMTFDPETRAVSVDERLFNPLTGEALKREDMPWNKRREKLKPVPENLRRNALDPMAAFVAARAQLMAQGLTGKAPKTFRVPIYDGTRRYDLVGKTSPVRVVSINGVERRLLPVTAKVEPVFGFNREGEERMRESEGKFLFTPDARFIPVQLIVGNDMFTSVMNLAADCRENAAACEILEQQAATN